MEDVAVVISARGIRIITHLTMILTVLLLWGKLLLQLHADN